MGDDNDRIHLRFRVRTDGAWSDQDGLFSSNGAVQIDDLSIRIANGSLPEFSDFHDFEDGTLEQLLLSSHPVSVLVLAKVLAHWLITGLPLLLISPLLGVLLGSAGGNAALGLFCGLALGALFARTLTLLLGKNYQLAFGSCGFDHHQITHIIDKRIDDLDLADASTD